MKNFNEYEEHEKEPFAACENPDTPMGFWLLNNIEKPANILDVGCGVGVHTKWFNEQGIDAKGITINFKEVEKRLHNNVQLGSMLDIPFDDETFDCVFCLGTLEHTHAPFIALQEFKRVLKKDGYLFLDMCGIGCMYAIDARFWYHKMVLFPIQIKDLLLRTGFDLIKGNWKENIDGNNYSGDACAHYLAKKTESNIICD